MVPRLRKSVVSRGGPSRRIVVVLVAPVDELDLVGPLQVFNSVNRLAGETLYSIEAVTNTDRLTVESESGVLSFTARHHFRSVAGPVDSVLVVCGLASRSVRDAALSAWLRKMSPQVRRVGAVCVGAFLLAEAGLLKGRRATAHWKYGRELAKRYPDVRVEHEPLWVKDGNLYTSAGISAGTRRRGPRRWLFRTKPIAAYSSQSSPSSGSALAPLTARFAASSEISSMDVRFAISDCNLASVAAISARTS